VLSEPTAFSLAGSRPIAATIAGLDGAGPRGSHAPSMSKQDALPLPRAPSTRAWNSLVDWFVLHPEACAAEHPAVEQARAALASWPATVLRPIPYAWVFRLAGPEGFAPALLGNALCLGDRWALAKSVGFNLFQSLDEEQSARLAALTFPLVSALDLSSQSRDNPYSPGVLMEWSALQPAALVTSKAFPALEALDVSGFGLKVEELEAVNERRPLRVLVMCESDLFDEDIEQLCESEVLKNLEYLDLSLNGFEEDGARALFRSPNLGKLTALRGFDRADFDKGFREELAALVRDSTLPATLKGVIAKGREGKPAWLPFEDAGFPGPMGGPLPREEGESEDEEEGES
jgi:hypothetical protein